MESNWEKIKNILPGVTRPGRYVGNEIHAIKKEWTDTEVHVALAFPDVYEIGMSHVGMGILYHILNGLPWVAAERVFSPWVDMESEMRRLGTPLFSIESKKSVRYFDILGISLQYELQYTNTLNLLDLSGIPLKSSDRQDRDPIVIAGGPCAFNPEPLAGYLDAVVLGDGEEVIVEIVELIRLAKRERKTRKEILQALAKLEGVYIPSMYIPHYDDNGDFQALNSENGQDPVPVHARMLDSLPSENYPTKPIVPLIEVTHDRFSMEIMRGCTRGCRFCNAGMVYRPVRERPVNELLKQAKEVLANTGHDEISLVSLSSSDYMQLPELMKGLKDTFQQDGVSISFPSLRPETFTEQIADLAVGLRRSGLTLAPEAGSQRLRDVINKNNREEDLLNALEVAYQRNWKQVKLYFMIGLPTETMDDIQAIVDLIDKVVAVGRRYGKKDVHVAISPFCPKPHTPFQWEPQDTVETIQKKINFLRQKIHWREVKLNWRDPNVSRIEGILSRGDRRLGNAIEQVWKNGGRFDAWSDQFKPDLWDKAFSDQNIDVDSMLGSQNLKAKLPWEHLSKGITKSFFLQERDKAHSQKLTLDCSRDGCKGCGIMEHPECRKTILNVKSEKVVDNTPSSHHAYGRRARREMPTGMKTKIRLVYKKGDAARFTSHLDMMRIFIRILRRAKVPVAMSQGFHAHPKIASGPPLSTGFTSQMEYLDLELTDRMPRDLPKLINQFMPAGIEVLESKVLLTKVPSLNGSINLAEYRIRAEWGMQPDDLDNAITQFLRSNEHRVKRLKKGVEKEVDIRPFVSHIEFADNSLFMGLKLSNEGSARVEEVVQALYPIYQDPPKIILAERTGLFIESQGRRLTPMDVE